MDRFSRQATLDGVNQIPHASVERPEEAIGGRRLGAAEGPKDAAVTVFGVDEAREERRHRQPLDVAGVDAPKQWFGDEVDGRLPEAAAKKTPDRFVGRVRTPWHDRFHRESRASHGRQQVITGNPTPAGRDSQH
jgi:hypothetical protein